MEKAEEGETDEQKSTKLTLLKNEYSDLEERIKIEYNEPKKRGLLWKIFVQGQFLYLIGCVCCCCLIGVLFFVGLTFLIRYIIKAKKEPTKHEIPSDPYERAVYLAERTPLIDGHNDMIERILSFPKKNISIEIHLDRSLTSSEKRILHDHNTTLMTDIPRLKEGHLGTQIWAVYVNCKIVSHEAVYGALQSFRLIQDMFQIYSDSFLQVYNSDQLQDVFEKKKIGGMMGVEGGQMIDENMDILRDFFRLGGRYLTLTHNCNTKWADSCCDPSGYVHHGLTEYGKDVLKEMNRIGMMIDLSHVSIDVMNQALDISEAPVIFSHSNARSLCNSSRNVPDEVLVRLKDNKGIIMVTFVPAFLSEAERLAVIEIEKKYNSSSSDVYRRIISWQNDNPEKRASINTVADHIDYIKKLHGSTEHIGIGSDNDGITYVPKGLEDSSKFMFLIEELIKRGYKDNEINQILGENFIRVLKEVEKVSEKLKIDSIFKK